jgi:hypothetical protein
MQVEVDRLDLDLVGLDPRQVEHLVDQRQQRARRGLDGPRVVALLARQARLHQQVGHADHTVERRAHLVAHVGDETALGLARQPCPFHRLLEAADHCRDVKRQHQQCQQQAHAEHAVLTPVRAAQQHHAEPGDAERGGQVEVAGAVAEAVADHDPEVHPIDRRCCLAAEVEAGAGRAEVDQHAGDAPPRARQRVPGDPRQDAECTGHEKHHRHQEFPLGAVDHAIGEHRVDQVADQQQAEHDADQRLLVLAVPAPVERCEQARGRAVGLGHRSARPLPGGEVGKCVGRRAHECAAVELARQLGKRPATGRPVVDDHERRQWPLLSGPQASVRHSAGTPGGGPVCRARPELASTQGVEKLSS